MKFGVFIFATEYCMPIPQLARALEERGFESLFVPEHTHIPASRESPWPGGPELPREYSHTLDPFVALAAAGAVTSRLRLGTGVCLVIEHDPIVLAKQVASLDQLSGGRVLCGVGGGWNREEMRNHGTDPARRWRLLRERVEAMKALWTQDEASYHGELVTFERVWQWPKPVQQPHPPVLMGGNGAHTLQRVVAYADEWMPIFGRRDASPIDRIPELQQLAEAAGRAPIPVSAFGTPGDAATIEQLQAAGVSRCLFSVPPADAERVVPILDRLARIVEQFPESATAVTG